MCKPDLPPPVQSEFEPDIWSGLVRYACGHVLHSSFHGKPSTQEHDTPCWDCSRPPVKPEWAAAGAECRRMRLDAAKAAQHSGASYWRMRENYSMRGTARAAGITASQLCSMERGEMDPAPLVAYWEGQGES